MQLAVRVCGPESVEVAAYARCLAQMSEDYSQFLSPGLPRPFYMPNPVPLYRQTLAIIEKVMGPEDQSVSRVFPSVRCPMLLPPSLTQSAPSLLQPPPSGFSITLILLVRRCNPTPCRDCAPAAASDADLGGVRIR